MFPTRYRLLLVFIFTAAILALALRTLDIQEMTHLLQEARWGYMVPSTALNVFTVGIICFRWQNLLNYRARFVDCISANQVGAYMNTLLPFRLGDFTRSYLLRRHVPDLSMIAILTSIGAELTFDMLVLILLLAGLLVVLPLPPLLTSAGGVLAVLTLIAVSGVLSLSRSDWFADSLARPLITRFLPHKLADFALHFLARMQEGLHSLRSNRQLAIIFALTIAGYIVQVISNWLLLSAFLTDVPLYAGLVALVGAGLGLALPLLPASAGTYEVAITLALTSLGIEPEIAAVFALSLRTQQLTITIVMGSLALIREGVSVRELQAVAQQAPAV